MESYTHKVYLWVYESIIDIVRTPQGDSIRHMTGEIHSYDNESLTFSDQNTQTGVLYIKDAKNNKSYSNDNGTGYNTIGFDASRSVPTDIEVRPVNIAVHYYIRAIGDDLYLKQNSIITR